VIANKSDCIWTATSNDSWITIISGSSGTGNGVVTFSVAHNSGSGSRTGTLTIAGAIARKTFQVIQAATDPSCTFSISPTSASYSLNGPASDQVKVIANKSDCAWTATSNDSWITIISGSSGSGDGVVRFSVSENQSSGSRTGTITVAGRVFAVIQAGAGEEKVTFFVSYIAPASGPLTGGTAINIQGSGFQVGASVTIGDNAATVASLTGNQINATTGTASTPGTYDVVVTNPGGQFATLHHGFTYLPSIEGAELFVPIVASAVGLNGSFFNSEMTLTNRGSGDVTVDFTYTSSTGTGSGRATDNLGPGQQKVVPDVINYLGSLGVPIPAAGNQAGTLRVTFLGLSSASDGGVTVRTTTAVPEGRAGLAYAGIPISLALTGPAYICGLRQDDAERSNLAIQNVGSDSNGPITLRLMVFSGEENDSTPHVLPDQVLAPGGWAQISEILVSNGLSLRHGYVRIERISGTAPYYAYGVINDQVNSDGSFVSPILENSLAGRAGLTLPVIVETRAFGSELVLCNWSTTPKTLHLFYAGDAIQLEGSTAHFDLAMNAGEQRIIPNFVQWLREQNGSGIGPVGPSYVGPLFANVDQADVDGIFMGARTSTPGGGGEYGVFYTATPFGSASAVDTWLYSLRQDSENRTNLAIVNTGEVDGNQDTFDIELFDGDTGTKVSTVRGVTIEASRWFQIQSILGRYAPNTPQGYAHIIRTSGINPFIAYTVINDGAHSGERSGDGAFIASSP